MYKLHKTQGVLYLVYGGRLLKGTMEEEVSFECWKFAEVLDVQQNLDVPLSIFHKNECGPAPMLKFIIHP